MKDTNNELELNSELELDLEESTEVVNAEVIEGDQKENNSKKAVRGKGFNAGRKDVRADMIDQKAKEERANFTGNRAIKADMKGRNLRNKPSNNDPYGIQDLKNQHFEIWKDGNMLYDSKSSTFKATFNLDSVLLGSKAYKLSQVNIIKK